MRGDQPEQDDTRDFLRTHVPFKTILLGNIASPKEAKPLGTIRLTEIRWQGNWQFCGPPVKPGRAFLCAKTGDLSCNTEAA